MFIGHEHIVCNKSCWQVHEPTATELNSYDNLVNWYLPFPRDPFPSPGLGMVIESAGIPRTPDASRNRATSGITLP